MVRCSVSSPEAAKPSFNAPSPLLSVGPCPWSRFCSVLSRCHGSWAACWALLLHVRPRLGRTGLCGVCLFTGWRCEID